MKNTDTQHPGLTPEQDNLLRDCWHPDTQRILRDFAARLHRLQSRERTVLSATASLSTRMDALERCIGEQGVTLLQRVTELEQANQPAPVATHADRPDLPPLPVENEQDELAHLRAEVERLTKERDEAMRVLNDPHAIHAYLLRNVPGWECWTTERVRGMERDLEKAIKERDEAREACRRFTSDMNRKLGAHYLLKCARCNGEGTLNPQPQEVGP